MNKVMKKSVIKFFVVSLIVLSRCHVFATLPPAYLGIKGWQACVSSQSQGTWKSLCLPNAKPSKCHAKAWQLLQALTGADAVPLCSQTNDGEQIVTSTKTMYSVAFN